MTKMPSRSFFFHLCVVFLCLLPAIATVTAQSRVRCNRRDKRVLLQIKRDLGNPYHLASWDPNTDCCDWYVVECDPATGRIVEFNLFQANISGQIPAAIGNLPYLRQLVFRHLTNLTGVIPSAIAKLTNLQLVRLSYTNLTGPVPAFFSQLKNLTYLDLSFNNLTGEIPPSLSQLPNLNALHLDRNNLTGPIPDSFGHFPATDFYLYLSHNHLSGSLPRSFAAANFTTLDLSRNNLSGDASFLFGTNKSLQTLDLSRNMFDFELTSVTFPQSLIYLDLNHNRLAGSLPQGLARLDLQLFNVSYNRLCGQIPSGGRLQSFGVTEYFHNRCLCGAPLPACH